MQILKPLQTTAPVKRLCVVANPVSGTNRTALETIKTVLHASPNVDAEVLLTEKSGDARRFVQSAVQEHMDLVLACGGDGTVMEVAAGLAGTDVPMAIIPCGTANVMAVELGIPLDIHSALALALLPDHPIRRIDMGYVDDVPFLLRTGIGYEAEVSAGASRAEKSRYGRLAYFHTAWRKLRNLQHVRYKITLDNGFAVARGITCMICNSSSIGVPQLQLVPQGNVSDGKLDIIVIPNLRPLSIMRLVMSVFRSVLPERFKEAPAPIMHWQTRRVTIEFSRRQMVVRDGEPFKRARRVTAWIVPDAVNVIVPPQATEKTVSASSTGR